jgi:outer membrane protein OmpA-like peptidoglycan-associated protein
MNRTVLQILGLVVAIAATSACATKGYVNEGLAEVNEKVETLSDSLEETQNRADAVGRDTERLMRLLYEVVLSQDQGDFKFGDANLPDSAKEEIDRLAGQLKSDAPKNVYIEIEGHTDATGEPEVNERLGLERAETVKRYLHESHQIPLHRMNTISYGEEKPVAPNATREGRAQNRRVVVRVLT